jgi:hypothetical protein
MPIRAQRKGGETGGKVATFSTEQSPTESSARTLMMQEETHRSFRRK